MHGVTLRGLRYFAALASHRHFGRAAEACAISQPAMSQQIRELETTLGAPLVERGGRRVALTAFGAAVAARAGDILRAVDELGEFARANADALTGTLRLGLIPTVAPYLFPAVFARLAREAPGLELRPREAVTHRLIEELRAGRLDAAIVALPVSEPSLTECPLFTEEFVLVRPRADAGTPAPRLERLREMRLLLLEEGHCFRAQALSYCSPSAASPGDAIEGGSLSTLVQMVGAGLGVTLIPQMAVALETRSTSIVATRLPPPRPTRSVGMVWRATSPLDSHFRVLARLVRAAARDAAGAATAPRGAREARLAEAKTARL